MIRDPSDGSVKEINPAANEINEMSPKKVAEGITSGLPISKENPKETERLVKSREWLRSYFEDRK